MAKEGTEYRVVFYVGLGERVKIFFSDIRTYTIACPLVELNKK